MTLEELEQLRIEAAAPTEPRASLPVIVRRKHPNDLAFVARSWLKSLRPSKPYADVSGEVFFYWHHQLVEGLWADPTAAWLMAVDPVDPDRIYGWLCGQKAESLAGTLPVVHYVYVAKAFRRFGLACRLMTTLIPEVSAAAVVVATAHTPPGAGVVKRLGAQVMYNPYLLWGRAAVPHPEFKAPNMRARNDPRVHSRRKLVHTYGDGGDEP